MPTDNSAAPVVDSAASAATAAPVAAAAPVAGSTTGTIAPAVAAPVVAPVVAPAVEPAKVDGKPVVPEVYADFALPEGATLAPESASAFKEVAKDLGLTQDSAQKVIDKMLPVFSGQGEAYKAQLITEARNDSEIGGDKFDETLATAVLARDAYFSPEFKKFLNDTGLGNHKEMIRGFAKIGATLKQDTLVPANKQTDAKNDAQSFYNKSNMQP